jgi:hypothetical protein
MKVKLDEIIKSPHSNDTIRMRARRMTRKLTAFKMRIRIFTGEPVSFDEESLQLFDVKVPTYNEQHFQSLVFIVLYEPLYY